MSIKSYKPTTPSRRHMKGNTFQELTKSTPLKSLTLAKKEKAGRNNTGRITVRHRGGGHKQRIRLIDFKGGIDKLNIPAKVTTLEYDPGRNGFIMLLTYVDGEKRYQLAPHEIQVGDSIIAQQKAPIQLGNRMQLKNIPVGYSIYNLELQPNKGGQIAKSAGNAAKLVSLDSPKAQVQLPSGEIRLFEKTCFASIGEMSNPEFSNITLGKAGRSRWLSKRPSVRGLAMNPVDHPHGGGEGSSPIGMKAPKTPWGLPALGIKTRNRKRTDKFIVKSRHSKK